MADHRCGLDIAERMRDRQDSHSLRLWTQKAVSNPFILLAAPVYVRSGKKSPPRPPIQVVNYKLFAAFLFALLMLLTLRLAFGA